MAVSSTLPVIRQRALSEIGKGLAGGVGLVIPNAYFDSAASTSVTSANMLRNSNWGPEHFRGLRTVIFRPGAATAADYIRYATTLLNTTGALSQGGANFSDTTVGTEVIELWYHDVRPDLEFVDCLNRSLQDCYYDDWFAISHLGTNDGDMASSGVTSWADGTGSPTQSKVTTGIRAPYGQRALRVLNDAANESVRSVTQPMGQGRQVSFGGIVSVEVVAASLIGYDITNSAAFGTAINSSEQEPQLLWRGSEAVPTTCRQMAVELAGTATLSDHFWNQVWLYKHDNLMLNLPSYVTEEFEIPRIVQMRPRVSAAAQTYDAGSLEPVELVKGRDYRLLTSQPGANPNRVLMLMANPYEFPLMAQGRLPYSGLTTFAADEAAATTCPLHLLMPRLIMEMCNSIYLPQFPDSKHFLAKLAGAIQDWRKANTVRKAPDAAPTEGWNGRQMLAV